MHRVTLKANPSAKPLAGPRKNIIKAMSVVIMVASLAGCASFSKDQFTVGSVPSDYRTKHPIVVAQNTITEDLVVNPGLQSISLRQRNVVTAFIAQYRNLGAGEIQVMLPAGSHNAAAARRIGSEIVGLMKEEGIRQGLIRVSRYHAGNHGDAATIRLAFSSLDAKVSSKCGQWVEDLTDTHENKNYHNFGCATQNNLAEMIANPEDLLSPRGQSEIDPDRRDNVINDWRENGTPGLPSLL